MPLSIKGLIAKWLLTPLAKRANFLSASPDQLEDLPQFQNVARIEKIAPLPSDEVPAGWFGGKPSLSDHIEWPIYDGKPMLFLAQLNCEKLPKQLWGGIGPRKGRLLFFVPLCYLGSDLDLKCCTVLHVDGLGPERSPDIGNLTEEELRNRHWMWTTEQKFMPVSATPFPKWPVRFLEVSGRDTQGLEKIGKNPPVGDEPEWTAAEMLFPVNWLLFDELLDSLIELVEGNNRFGGRKKGIRSEIDKIEDTPSVDRTFWHNRQLEC